MLQYLVGGLVASAIGALGGASPVAMGAAIFLSSAAALLVFASGPRVDRHACLRSIAAVAEQPAAA